MSSDRQTDRQGETNIPPLTSWGGGVIKQINYIYTKFSSCMYIISRILQLYSWMKFETEIDIGLSTDEIISISHYYADKELFNILG